MNRKIENFFSSLDTLHEASVTDYTQNKIVLSGCVNTFCLTFELSWKAMKYVLESEGVDKGRTGSPKLILMAALTRGLIEDENAWLRMLRLRNDESHHYNQDCAIELCRFSFPIDSDAATSCKEKDSIVGKKLQVGRYSGDKKGDD